jgi:hypothetical protein
LKQGGRDGIRGMIRDEFAQSFVARIWLERGPGGAPVWRGHVRQVHGEEDAHFQNLAEMSAFLERVSGVRGPAPALPKPTRLTLATKKL